MISDSTHLDSLRLMYFSLLNSDFCSNAECSAICFWMMAYKVRSASCITGDEGSD